MQVSVVVLAWIAALRLSSSIANYDDDGRTRPRLFPQNQLDRQPRPARLLAHEWMAIMTGRTLIEMSPSERADMMTLVVNALESVAEDAGERGDLKSARNATYLACSIRGCGIEASTDMLRAAEILLEQGINYVASLSERFEGVSDESDEPEGSSEHQSRILH